MDEVGIVGAIIEKATSDVTLVVALIVVGTIIAGKPLYKLFSENLASKRKRESEREKNLLVVIQGNSTIMAELKTLLNNSARNCDACRVAQLAKFKHLEDMLLRGQLTLNDIKNTIQDATGRIKEIQQNK